MQVVVRPHARNLVRFAQEQPEVVVFSADLTSSCEAEDFAKAYPDRFFSFGLAEQNMVGFAAGMAREGYYPYVHTFAVFITRRTFDQVAMSIAYPNLPVRLVGFLPGITTPGGATHQAIDDLGLMRLMPNMTVIECGDATDVESCLDVAQQVDGPVYLRMLRGEVVRLFSADEPMVLGKPRVVRRGRDVAIISSGICTEEAMRAGNAVAARGVSVYHLHVSTIKPFRAQELIDAIGSVRYGAVVVENHGVIGGLGSALAEKLVDVGVVAKRLIRLGLQDQYAHGASRAYLLRNYGLDAIAIVGAIERILGVSFDIPIEELQTTSIDTPRSVARPEDL
jgi:transketolase